jgi:hypothetical protein
MRYLCLFLLLISFQVFAETVHQGKVVRIVDGDTLVLLVDEKQLKIRLSDIDTPERKQPFGTKAKLAASDLVFGKQARRVHGGPECGAVGSLAERRRADVDRAGIGEALLMHFQSYKAVGWHSSTPETPFVEGNSGTT